MPAPRHLRAADKAKRLTFDPDPLVTLIQLRDGRNTAHRVIHDYVDPVIEQKQEAAPSAAGAETMLDKVLRVSQPSPIRLPLGLEA